jgi:hypothetical protein
VIAAPSTGATRPAVLRLLVFAALIAIIATLMIASLMLRGYAVSGDEPHYMINGLSIFQDGDLALSNNYGFKPFEHLQPIWPHAFQIEGEWYPWRGIGVPVLVGLPFMLFGIPGAKAALAVVCGLLSISLVVVARRHVPSERAAFGVAALFALSLPMLVAHTEVFPDMILGYLILIGTWFIIRVADGERMTVGAARIFALVLLALVWVYWRHLMTALVLMVIALVLMARSQRHPDSANPRAVWLTVLAGGVLAVASIGTYLALMGNLGMGSRINALGPWASLSALAGQHLDQSCGILFRNPALWIAVPGWLLFARRNPWGFVATVLVYGLVIGPPSLTGFAYGGSGMCSRYTWNIVPLWIIPMAYMVAFCWQTRLRRRLFWLALSVALAIQAWYMWRLLVTDSPALLRVGGWDRWILVAMLGEWRWYLPSFPVRSNALTDMVSVAWLLVLALVFASPLLIWKLRLRAPSVIACFVAMVVALGVMVRGPAMAQYSDSQTIVLQWNGFRGKGEVERRVGFRLDNSRPGHYLLGGERPLPTGYYRYTLSYRSSDPGATVELTDGGKLVGKEGRRTLPTSGPAQDARVSLDVQVERGAWMRMVSVLVRGSGKGEILATGATIERLPDGPSQ